MQLAIHLMLQGAFDSIKHLHKVGRHKTALQPTNSGIRVFTIEKAVVVLLAVVFFKNPLLLLRDGSGRQGFVPANYIQMPSSSSMSSTSPAVVESSACCAPGKSYLHVGHITHNRRQPEVKTIPKEEEKGTCLSSVGRMPRGCPRPFSSTR